MQAHIKAAVLTLVSLNKLHGKSAKMQQANEPFSSQACSGTNGALQDIALCLRAKAAVQRGLNALQCCP